MLLDLQKANLILLCAQLWKQEEGHDVILACLLEERHCLPGRRNDRERRWWVGHYNTLFKDLEHEAQGDYQS